MSNPKRARGEGTVYYDQARDRYIGAVTVNGRRRKVSAKTVTEARAKLAEILAAKTTGAPLPNKRTTVAEVVDSWLERDLPNRKSRGRPLAPKTIEQHRWAAEHVRREIGKIAVAELSEDDVEAMLDRLARRRSRPLGRASLSRIKLTLSIALDRAERRRQVTRNVASGADVTPTAARTEARRSLSPVEARALLTQLRHERNGLMFALSLRLGLRPGEAAALLWEDVDGDTLSIRHGLRGSGSTVEVVDILKTEASERTIGLPDDLVEWIAEHRAAQNVERIAAERWLDDRLMFPTTSGSTQLPRNTRRQLSGGHETLSKVKRDSKGDPVRGTDGKSVYVKTRVFRGGICQRAGVTAITPNELRHSCASLLSDEGVPNELIADLLGHTTTRMVDQTYRHRLRPVVDVAATATWAQQS